MKNYLSIGELAKIRNLDVQSLRYYEKLGILIPAYVNPKNGYRYYALDQVMVLDTILLCIELGIPLKRLQSYMDESGRLALEQLLKDGLTLAYGKIEKLHTEIRSINQTLKHIDTQRPYIEKDGYYVRHIFERHILLLPCDWEMDAGQYENGLSRLLQQAQKIGLRTCFPHGMSFIYENGECTRSCLFVEVLDRDAADVVSIEEGDYLCLREPRERHSPPSDVFPEEMFDGRTIHVIVSSMLPDPCGYDEVSMEFQMPVSSAMQMADEE